MVGVLTYLYYPVLYVYVVFKRLGDLDDSKYSPSSPFQYTYPPDSWMPATPNYAVTSDDSGKKLT